MFPGISKLFMVLGGKVGVWRSQRATIVCIMLIVIAAVQHVVADEMEAGVWTQKADMPTARYIAGSAVVDEKIYTTGRSVGEGGEIRSLVSTAEGFDPGLPGAISSVSPAGKLLETRGQIRKFQ